MTAARMGKGAAKAAVTDWYPGDVKPARVGVYERLCTSGRTTFQYWNGKFYGFCSASPEGAEAAYKRFNKSGFQYTTPWRGLASDPNGVAE